MNLRLVEDAKIRCVKKLFNDLSDLDVQYHQVTSFEDLLDKIRQYEVTSHRKIADS